MENQTTSQSVDRRLRVTTLQYLAAYALLSHATSQLELLAATRGAYKRTRRSIARAFAMVLLVGALVGLWNPTTSHATPVFAAPVTNAFGSSAWPFNTSSSPALADIDGDGDLDLYVGGFYQYSGGPNFKYNATLLFENTGTATAPAFTNVGTNADGLMSQYIAINFYGGEFHGGPALVDIDNDGDLDFFEQDLLGSAGNGTRFFENTGNADAAAFTLGPDPTGWSGGNGDADALVDIDGDGDLDVFHGRSYYGAPVMGPSIVFQENNGNADSASFGTQVYDAFGLVAVDEHSSPAFLDADGDGDLDAFIGGKYGDLDYQENTGTPAAPAFGAPVSTPFGFTPVGFHAKPAFGDIDGDGDADLFLGTIYSNLYFFENTEINCGDGILDPSEVCDGAALDGETCVGHGYDSGVPTCAADCLSISYVSCVGVPCPATPSGGCLAPGQSQLQIKDSADAARDSLKFKWKKGAAFNQAALGNPATTNNVALCVYDRTGGVPSLEARISIPTSGYWVSKDPKGLQYADKAGGNGGITRIKIKTGDAGKTSASLQARGVNLGLPFPFSMTEFFDQDTTVTVQLIDDSGLCLSSDFAAGGTTKNDGTQFKAK